MKIFSLCSVLIFLFAFGANALPAEKRQKQDLPLSKQEIRKLKDIAVIITGELIRKNIKTVSVKDFTDIKSRPSKKGKAVAYEFRKQIEIAGKANFTVRDNAGDAVITGVFLPFVGGDKWKLDLKVFSSDNRLITSYTAFYRKTRGAEK